MVNPLSLVIDQKRAYVVGDIHGCPRELEALLNFLKTEEKFSIEDNIIFIGDYINKGNHSRDVINLLLSWKNDYPQTKFLRGNHEDMLLGYLGYPNSYGDIFLRNGGEKTLISYQIEPGLNIEETKSKFPEGHIDFLLSLENYVVSEEYAFAHAGLAPLKGLNDQDIRDLFWIRDEFIQNIHKHERVVVFGHTPFNDVWIDLPYKIGIDTGLVYKNMLSCIELREKSIFQVKFGKKEVAKRSW